MKGQISYSDVKGKKISQEMLGIEANRLLLLDIRELLVTLVDSLADDDQEPTEYLDGSPVDDTL